MRTIGTLTLAVCATLVGCAADTDSPAPEPVVASSLDASAEAVELGIDGYVLLRGPDTDVVEQLDDHGNVLAVLERGHGTTDSVGHWTDDEGTRWSFELDSACLSREGESVHCFDDSGESPDIEIDRSFVELNVRRLIAAQNDYEERWGLLAPTTTEELVPLQTATKCCAKTCSVDVDSFFCDIGCPAGGDCTGGSFYSCCTYCVEGSCGTV